MNKVVAMIVDLESCVFLESRLISAIPDVLPMILHTLMIRKTWLDEQSTYNRLLFEAEEMIRLDSAEELFSAEMLKDLEEVEKVVIDLAGQQLQELWVTDGRAVRRYLLFRTGMRGGKDDV